MLKPVAGPIIYGLSVINDPSLLSKYKALNFLIVFGSVALTASTSDDDASTHALRGVLCILAASVANAVYAVGLQVIQARDFEEVRFNSSVHYSADQIMHNPSVPNRTPLKFPACLGL